MTHRETQVFVALKAIVASFSLDEKAKL